ncbi:cold-shock protein [Streptomyces sp. NPDC012769]|uniref:cold-shock protein n=1 Tax=Streptomyces sp. NPDC012769 TaxID=3364848 RepID=UPI0036AD6F6A
MVHQGIVKWFNAEKGFGFIAPDDGGPDAFVPASALPGGSGSLEDNQRVEYELAEGTKGPQVEKVTVIR